jgi:hypothetical protein
MFSYFLTPPHTLLFFTASIIIVVVSTLGVERETKIFEILWAMMKKIFASIRQQPRERGVECEQTRKQELLYKLAFHMHKSVTPKKHPHTYFCHCADGILCIPKNTEEVFISESLCEICYLIVQLENLMHARIFS